MQSTPHVVLITGASSGIGEALAREFARRGFHLILIARRTDRLNAIASDLRSAEREVLVFPGDVSRDGDLERIVALARGKLGRIDIVVANAGFGVVGDVASLTVEDFKRQFETNVFGVLRTLYATLPDLRQSKGVFGVIGSVNGHLALPGNAAYSMSKFSVKALADSLRHELHGEGIAVTHVSPGFVDTEIRRVDNHGAQKVAAADPIPKFMQMSASTAARIIARALLRREKQQTVTAHAKVVLFLHQYFPFLADLLIRAFGVRARPQVN